MTVLILADELDVTADHVVRALHDRDATVHRIDTAWFPAQLSFHAELRGAGWAGELRTPHRVVDLTEVHAVWYRSPTTFQFPTQLSPVERQHAHTEAKLGLGGVLASLNVLWVNHPNRIADAVYKPVQLVTAAQCGLLVPDTLITNQPAAVRRFATDAPHQTVTKALGAVAIGEEGRRKVAFTRRLSQDDLNDLAGIDVTAHQFQRWVPKAYDARVIVIGRHLYAFAIHAGTPEAHLDFRRDYDALRYERIDIPAAVADGITRFMSTSRLVYGALDFVVTPDGEWMFLENNPGGQYGWLEAHTDAPLTATLADLLATGGTP